MLQFFQCSKKDEKQDEKRPLLESKEAKTEAVSPSTSKKSNHRILLVCHAPNKEAQKNRIADRIARHQQKGASVIYVDPEDFDPKTGQLIEDKQYKYNAFKYASKATKITIIGHGFDDDSLNRIRSDFGRDFTSKNIASIFNLIPAISSARVSRPRYKEITRLPENHLKISVQSCCGENFSRHLFRELNNSGEYPLIFSIYTGEKSKVTVITENGKKFYEQIEECSIRDLQRCFNFPGKFYVFEIIAGGLCIVGMVNNNIDMLKIALIMLVVDLVFRGIGGILHCCGAAISPPNSNRQDKVVLFPNFGENTDSQPMRIVTKEDFIKFHDQAEDILREPEDHISSTQLESRLHGTSFPYESESIAP